MKFIINTFIIIFVVATIYTVKDDILPGVEYLGNLLYKGQNLAIDVGNRTLSEIKKPSLEKIPTILTPGPLNVEVSVDSNNLSKSDPITLDNIIKWTNIARQTNGKLLPLVKNTNLNNSAKSKVDDMFVKQYFEHNSPIGVTVGELAKNANYEYVLIGENLALGNFQNAKSVVDAWMGSPGHRANILTSSYIDIGVGLKQGIYEGRNVWMLVQHFGIPMDACPEIDQKMKVQIDINITRLEEMKREIEGLRNKIESSNQNFDFAYEEKVDKYNELVRNYNNLAQDTKVKIDSYNDDVKLHNACIQSSLNKSGEAKEESGS
jgi:uncharacterized protein YkwD